MSTPNFAPKKFSVSATRLSSLKTSAVAVVLGLLLTACSESEEQTERAKPVSTVIVSNGNNAENRLISGVVQSANTTPLNFEVTGKVEEVYLDIGEAFQQGDKLAKLEQIDYELALKERQGMLSEAKARLQEAQNDFQRKRALVKDGAVSKAQLDASRAQFESAKDQVDIASARLAMAQEALDDTILLAPYAGTISARMIEPSQRVNPNMPVFTIQGETGLEVSALIPESLLGYLSLGQTATVKFPAVNKMVAATIQEIGSAAADASSFPIIMDLQANDSQLLKPGMSAEVALTLKNGEQKTGLMLPVTALSADANNQHFVMALNAEEQGGESAQYRLSKIPVQVQSLFDQHAIVTGAVADGAMVVDAGLTFLSEGQLVRPIREGVALYNP